ncbi:MAG: protein-L-isoaspartate(D-aspartate) O-methyltransferase [Chloroflexota bacterium]
MNQKWVFQSFCLLVILGLLSACQGTEPAEITTPTTTIIIPTATLTPSPIPSDEDKFTQLRLKMVATTIEARGVQNPDVLTAMRTVPRHLFVPEEYRDYAYEDHPLPIGYGQTISQPYMVAWMTELLELKPGEKVLEIGTGSGYQAAILAALGYVEVYSIEIVPELATKAATTLQSVGYPNVHLRQGDGYYGWEEAAPFDAIIVTAAPDHLPLPLAQQLAEGGRLVIPIGPPGWIQTLWKFVEQEGELIGYNMGGCQFVPFTGEGVKTAEATEPVK